MPDVDPFFDTNIVIYALSKDPQRKEQVAELLNNGCTLSTQVLAESAKRVFDLRQPDRRYRIGSGMRQTVQRGHAARAVDRHPLDRHQPVSMNPDRRGFRRKLRRVCLGVDAPGKPKSLNHLRA
jgi:hypothetical protein